MELALFVGGAVLLCLFVGAVVGTFVRLLVWLVLLPFRLIGWLLFLPLLLVKAVVWLAGILLSPVLAVLAIIAAAVAAGLFLPLFPILVIAGLVWLIVKAAQSPKRPIAS